MERGGAQVWRESTGGVGVAGNGSGFFSREFIWETQPASRRPEASCIRALQEAGGAAGGVVWVHLHPGLSLTPQLTPVWGVGGAQAVGCPRGPESRAVWWHCGLRKLPLVTQGRGETEGGRAALVLAAARCSQTAPDPQEAAWPWMRQH
ncbi:hypothetical protein SKAU_G00121920 [Synaphobranchus kaupii]|uniref:Uncharacterized protein n=1 Tax=Synaphobranchus kaupii TaxID=118154 RepID=A0A9Q1FP80_SYNKA|nr:hypothetical protein SKAU_G00121920 [Synaphobranchus kaupii]